MLTGDKGKTAKMIGIQCGLFEAKIDKPTTPRPIIENDELEVTEENANNQVKYSAGSKHVGETSAGSDSKNKP